MGRIKKARIKNISLVPRGANRLPVIYKSDDNSVDFDTLIVKSDEEGEITAIAYAPESPDAHGDYADARVIKEMCESFAIHGEGIDIRHDEKALSKDQAAVTQSYIIGKAEAEADYADLKDRNGNPVNAEGAWKVVLKIEDENLRKLYREKQWEGVSIGGFAAIEKDEADDRIITKFIKAILGKSGDASGDITMTEKEMEALLTKQTEALGTVIAKALEPLTKKDDTTPPDGKEKDKTPDADKPVFKGDYSDEDALRKFEKEVRIWEAKTEHGDGTSKFISAVREINKEFDTDMSEIEKEAGIEEKDSQIVRDLKIKLAKEQKRSNQGNGGKDGLDSPLTKSDDLAKEAKAAVASFRATATK